MVNFYYSQLEISCFRGVRKLTLDLSDDAPTVLIGPNNAGKSTVLDAMGLGLGSPKFSKYVVDDDDFWTDGKGSISDDFEIILRFAPRNGGSLPAVKGGVGDPIYVHGVRVVGNRGEPSTTRYLLDDGGQNILLTTSVPISQKKKDEFKGQGLGGRRFAKLMDISKWLPTVFQLDAQNLFTSLYTWQTGPLNRLMEMYRDHLMKDSWSIDPKRNMPEHLDKLHAHINEAVLQSPYWKDVLFVELTAKLKEFLGRAPGFRIQPQLESVAEWLKSELMFKVSPATDLAAVDSKRLGAGWQSLIRLAALEVVMKLDDSSVTLLMEEPETFLHPHLRRRMRRVFDDLQSRGSQCVISTHSAEMISFGLRQDIVRLKMTADGVVANRYSTTHASQAMKDEEKLHERGNHEVVFANAAVLTEGKDDECAVAIGLEKYGIDCDAESISIVDCGGISNQPDYAKLCKTLGIPWVAIHDKDVDRNGAQKPNTAKVAATLSGLVTDTDYVLTWDNSLEEVLGCPHSKAEPQWTVHTHGGKTWKQLSGDTALAQYCAVVKATATACVAAETQGGGVSRK